MARATRRYAQFFFTNLPNQQSPRGYLRIAFKASRRWRRSWLAKRLQRLGWARSRTARHGQTRRRSTSFWTFARCCLVLSLSTQTPSSSFWRAMRGRGWAESHQQGSLVVLEVALPTAAALPDSPSTAERESCRPWAFFQFHSA